MDLQTLAERATMSRTSFALRFKELVGLSPMDYLTRWRMTLAAARLTHSPARSLKLASRSGMNRKSPSAQPSNGS
ncbi:helix-turn-helix domain-containing protein [Paraburkholderia tropica]|uniref:helix-turn-helix domain-containing protein n=1 Tax=Paraburkholderia tropica TaxID=92647 RepID=UPI0030198E2C